MNVHDDVHRCFRVLRWFLEKGGHVARSPQTSFRRLGGLGHLADSGASGLFLTAVDAPLRERRSFGREHRVCSSCVSRSITHETCEFNKRDTIAALEENNSVLVVIFINIHIHVYKLYSQYKYVVRYATLSVVIGRIALLTGGTPGVGVYLTVLDYVQRRHGSIDMTTTNSELVQALFTRLLNFCANKFWVSIYCSYDKMRNRIKK